LLNNQSDFKTRKAHFVFVPKKVAEQADFSCSPFK